MNQIPGRGTILALLLVLSGCCGLYERATPRAQALPVQPTQQSRVQLPLGQPLVLRLPATAGSGYHWSLVAAPEGVLSIAAAPVFEPEPAAAAGAGREVWTFNPLCAGQQDLRFEYRRGLLDETPARTLVYSVVVR